MSPQAHLSGRQLLTREDVLRAEDRPFEWVEVPEWTPPGQQLVGAIYLKGTTLTEFLALTSTLGEGLSNEEFGVRLIVHCAVDPDTDQPIFSLDDVVALSAKSSTVMTRLISAARRVIGLDTAFPKSESASLPTDSIATVSS